jgi:hypothetical protein
LEFVARAFRPALVAWKSRATVNFKTLSNPADPRDNKGKDGWL